MEKCWLINDSNLIYQIFDSLLELKEIGALLCAKISDKSV